MVQIGLIGVGLVGKELLNQLSRVSGFKVVGVMNSRRMVLTQDTHLPLNEIVNKLESETSQVADLKTFIKAFGDNAHEKTKVLVDCTSSESVAACYPEWLSSGFHIVTPNKKGFSGDFSLYSDILKKAQENNKYIYHESTVGAGLPTIETLNNLVRTGDKVIKIEGIFSGTLSYIFNNFSSFNSSSKFSDTVKIAKEKGFTEPDPRDDLNGMDVARKVIILGRVVGLDLTMEKLVVENIVPQELREITSASEFMDKLPNFDDHFEKLNKDALNNKEVLRYVGVVDTTGQSSVKLMKYPADHPFASLTGSDNIIAFTTERFPSPLIIQGAGAGSAVTVFGILSDLLKIQERV